LVATVAEQNTQPLPPPVATSQDKMTHIGILYRSRGQVLTLLEELHSWLAAQGLTSWQSADWSDPEVAAHMPETSLLIVLGGDGSILRAARLAAPYDVPIFGINFGRVGFLSEALPDSWHEKLERVIRGDCMWERRLMLKAAVYRAGALINTAVALNDVVIGRGAQARVIRLRLYVDGEYITSYTADGLIAATPTGSTAYSLAAGGPLLPPQLLNFLVLPVAPHLSFDRALVLHQEARVEVELFMDHEASLTADGQDIIPLQNEDKIEIQKHDHTSRFARLGQSSYFYHRLMERLGLGLMSR
jgi:NAD+ kinase